MLGRPWVCAGGAQKEVGQALQMFESRLAPKTEVQVAHAAVTGPTFTSNAGAAQVRTDSPL